jgi:hypothetical protein
MPSPTKLLITVLNYNASTGAITTTVINVPIPPALQTLDSQNAGGSGQASQQTGYSAVDQLVRAIFRAGVFTDNAGNWFPSNMIVGITSQ